MLRIQTIFNTVSNFVKNRAEIKFAFIQLTSRCNAKCVDRCNIWASKPVDISLSDIKFVIDMLAENNYTVIYFTGGEPGLYPHLVEAVTYAQKKGMITSITSNGSIPRATLKQLSKSLDILSISVDHYNERLWDEAKHVAGMSKTARGTVEAAKACGIKPYGITFLNPAWSVKDVEQVVRFVNDDLGIPFALSYPYISSSASTFVVGETLRDTQAQTQHNVRDMVAKVLQMKMQGFDVATTSCYLHDVLRAHAGLPMKYPCAAGKIVVTIDCNLDVFPCFKRQKLFNLKEQQDLNLPIPDNSSCDNKNCLVNCFKEVSIASRENLLSAVKEEFFPNIKFYLNILSKTRV